MSQALQRWEYHRRYLRNSCPASSRQYASVPKPTETRFIPSRPPEREKPRNSNKLKEEPEGHKEAGPKRRPWRELWTPRFLLSRPWLRGGLFSFFVSIPILTFAGSHTPFTLHTVTGPSMRPTLNSDCTGNNDTLYNPDGIVVQIWSPNAVKEMVRRASSGSEIYTGKYKRGDIIAYWAPHNPIKLGVKRVVGLPGDSVIPMKGYNGEDDPAPVIIPFNHLWIEGDANDRRKSVDSNHFGPISQALVVGRATARYSRWWNVPSYRRLDKGENGWPARKQGRVTEGAVHEATVNPDALAQKQSFEQGEQSDAILQYLKDQPTRFIERWEDESKEGFRFRTMIKRLSVAAYDVSKGHGDKETRDRARQVLLELQRLAGTKALSNAATTAEITGEQTRKRWTPVDPEDEQESRISKEENDLFADLVIPDFERARDQDARARPAAAALKKMLEQKKRIADAVDKEYEELDKAKLQRSGQTD